MPLLLSKKEDENALEVERRFYAKRFVLRVDREKCRGCGICELVCHTKAISLNPMPKENVNGEERAVKARIEIDPSKCDHCGMCEAICPFAAIEHRVNDKPIVSVVEKGSFPEYIREIIVDPSKCDFSCVDYEKACPLSLITVKVFDEVGQEVKDAGGSRREPSSKRGDYRVSVEIDEKSCPCCRVCELKFPEGVIKVRKIFNGTINVTQEKCPEGCRNCLEVCPVEALYLGKDGKVYPEDTFCVYCGACVKVCPEEGALKVTRTSIRHTPVKSGAWNKALEKLTDEKGFERELRTKRTVKALDALKGRSGIRSENL